MKAINKIAMFALACLALVACDKHDSLDDQVFAGKIAPTVYWEVKSTTVTAGDSVPFVAQYYTTGQSEVDYLEVWYDIVEIEVKEVSSPMLGTTAMSISSNVETQKRISTASCKFNHADILLREGSRESSGVDSLGIVTTFQETYKFTDKFPTSGTLSVISMGDANWDSASVARYFGDDFMQNFKDSIEIKLKGCAGYGKDAAKGYNKVLANQNISEYQTVWVSIAGRDGKEFEAFRDSIVNPTESAMAGYEVYDYFFKDSILPDVVDSAFLGLEFKDLIFSGTEYKINYKKSYKLNAQLKCFDKDGIAGLSLLSVIDLN